MLLNEPFVDGWVRVHHISGDKMAALCTFIRIGQARRCGLVIWAMFCWETLRSDIRVHVNFDTPTSLNIVTDHNHHFMAMVFLNVVTLRQAHYKNMKKKKCVQIINNNSKRWPGLQNIRISILLSICGLWKRVQTLQFKALKESAANQHLSCPIPQDTFRSLRKSRSELFGWLKGAFNNIRQLVSMLWLIVV